MYSVANSHNAKLSSIRKTECLENLENQAQLKEEWSHQPRRNSWVHLLLLFFLHVIPFFPFDIVGFILALQFPALISLTLWSILSMLLHTPISATLKAASSLGQPLSCGHVDGCQLLMVTIMLQRAVSRRAPGDVWDALPGLLLGSAMISMVLAVGGHGGPRPRPNRPPFSFCSLS